MQPGGGRTASGLKYWWDFLRQKYCTSCSNTWYFLLNASVQTFLQLQGVKSVRTWAARRRGWNNKDAQKRRKRTFMLPLPTPTQHHRHPPFRGNRTCWWSLQASRGWTARDNSSLSVFYFCSLPGKTVLMCLRDAESLSLRQRWL